MFRKILIVCLLLSAPLGLATDQDETVIPVGAANVMSVVDAHPETAHIGQPFVVKVVAALTVSLLPTELTFPDLSNWVVTGCDVQLSDSGGTVGLSTWRSVEVNLTGPTCSISSVVNLVSVTGATTASIPFSMVINDANPAQTLTADVEVTAWPELLASVDIDSWPELLADVNVTAWPELFASVDIDQWPALAGALGIEITDWPTLISQVSGIDVNATFLDAFQNATVESTQIEPEDFPSHKWFPLIFFMALMLWCLWNGYRLPALAAMLGAIGTYSNVGIGEVGALYLFILAIWLTYYANTRKEKDVTN